MTEQQKESFFLTYKPLIIKKVVFYGIRDYEDTVQDVFCIFFAKFGDSAKHEKDLRNILVKIARDVSMDFWKKKKMQTNCEEMLSYSFPSKIDGSRK
jgi:DNA-directed RNA polymerase specialized sigma24 family protein